MGTDCSSFQLIFGLYGFLRFGSLRGLIFESLYMWQLPFDVSSLQNFLLKWKSFLIEFYHMLIRFWLFNVFCKLLPIFRIFIVFSSFVALICTASKISQHLSPHLLYLTFQHRMPNKEMYSLILLKVILNISCSAKQFKMNRVSVKNWSQK